MSRRAARVIRHQVRYAIGGRPVNAANRREKAARESRAWTARFGTVQGRWDAIEAMGGPRRSPGAAVTALGEAIRVIRALWDDRSRSRAHVDGEHYRLAGAHRGPRPVHDAGIWVGAYKPRMLQLTGRLADGWWPSLPALAEHGSITVAEGNAVVDQAAREAGRSPAEIRRLLNLGDPLPAEKIAELALEDGVSVFTVDVTDRYSIERLARETSPAVRELVAAERRRRSASIHRE